MEEDDLFYLQPGFDLNSLTIPKLRNILVSQNVPFPSSAKKQQLIDVINAEIVSKARKLLSAQARVRRTSKGITDVPSSQDGTMENDDNDEELMPPPPARTPRSRKSKSNLVNENGVASTPSTSRRSKTPSAHRSTTRPRVSDSDTNAENLVLATRKSRKSVPVPTFESPAVRIDEPDAQLKRESIEGVESPFTDENPFQSGSSPVPESRRTSSRPRKSINTLSTDKRKSTSKRRQTDLPSLKQEVTPTRSKYETQVTRLGSNDGIDITEEFTPDAALELKEEEAVDGRLQQQRESALVRHKKKPTSTAAKIAPLAVFTSVLALIGGAYRKEKIEIGYCGVGKPTWSLGENPHIPSWVHESVAPACEPCPQHAICYPNLEAVCEENYVLQQHPLSLNGFLPLPPTCEPDSEKERRIKAVADRAVEELRERRAAYECGEEVSSVKQEENAHPQASAVKSIIKHSDSPKLEVAEETLKAEVSKLRRRGMSADEFQDLWRGALGDIIARDEVDVIRDG